ncbi:MAG: hypothetical protein EXS36_04330 [Pedosphaera sp.]|nr:hypothetical protein [Pedosphaera sp.]
MTLRAVNIARLLCGLAVPLFLLDAAARAVVISEIFYDPPDPTRAEEFIELQNTDSKSIDISEWALDGGVQFLFPAGSTVDAGGFAVVARDPIAFAKRFGFRPFGPWIGHLRKNGEEIQIRNETGTVVNTMQFGAGFPWPTAARGAGASIELINPILDNTAPGAWRSSQPGAVAQPKVFVPESSSDWHYRKGTTEASNPLSSWRTASFVEDASWLAGKTSIGYGDDDDNTPLADMQSNYSSLFLRHRIEISPGAIPDLLLLRVRVDDGCVVWLNGVEVARLHVPAGNLPFNAFGQDHEAAATFEEILLTNGKTLLHTGANLLAIHAFNVTLSSSDLTIDAELRTPGITTAFSNPTPGATNSAFTANPPPLISEVHHAPQQPSAGSTVVVTAHVADRAEVAEVMLRVQAVDPGAYVRLKDELYQTRWEDIPMHDDGLNGDPVSRDGVYTAVLPASFQVHRRLIRYRVVARNAAGTSLTVPYADDGCPNFAWFTYNGPPEWRGANRPGAAGTNGAVISFPTTVLNSLPIYQLIANASDVTRSQYDSSANNVRMRGTLVYDGVVYDHIQFNNRGEASTYVSGKNKWRFHFNRARAFAARDAWDRPYREGWDTLNLNGCSSPWAAVNRGMAGLDEAISFRVYQLLGNPASHTHHVHFRIVENTAESSSTSQYVGDLWGLYLAVEQPDGAFLDEHGLPDGNIYKLEGGPDKKHQSATQATNSTDWNTFAARSGSTQPEAWWRTNFDLTAYYNFHLGNRIVGNIDLREDFNHYFYHRPDGHWVPIPWDLDMQFIPKSHLSGTIVQRACLSTPSLRTEFRNRAREILDLLLTDVSPKGGQIGQLIDETAGFVRNPAGGRGWPELDQYLWNWNPRTAGDGSSTGQTSHKGNFFRTPFNDLRIGGSWVRTLASSDFAGFLGYLLEYCTDRFPGVTWSVNNGQQKGYGFNYVQLESRDADVPTRPVISSVGSPHFALGDLRFRCSDFTDPQGPGTFAAIQWRIAEIAAPGLAGYVPGTPRKYEIESTWESDLLPRSSMDVSIPVGDLRTGHTYRVRARFQDNTARWSSWSESIQFMASAPDVSALRHDLRISEVMYHPPAATAQELAAGFSADDFEYLELRNIGSSSIDLAGLRFTAGIEFSFPDRKRLSAGSCIVVAKNKAAFEKRYGTGWNVAGFFGSESLNNHGELLRLSYGLDSPVIEFTYSDRAPWPTAADGEGPSLELIDPNSGPDPSVPGNWRSSDKSAGSPGRSRRLSYLQWTSEHLGTADTDKDGRSNWIEFAVGSDPTLVDREAVLKLDPITAADGSVTVHFPRNLAADGVTAALESSRDLAAWSSDAIRVDVLSDGGDQVTEVWVIPAGQSTAGGQRFIRLKWSP